MLYAIKDDKQKIINQVEKGLKDSKKLPASVTELAGDAAKGFCETLLKNFVGKAADELVEAFTTTIKQAL